jgi:hypothetical protein
MDAQEIANNLNPLYEAAMKEQRHIQACMEALTRSAKNFINDTYKEEIQHLSAEGYKELEKEIDNATSDLAQKIVSVFHHHTEE